MPDLQPLFSHIYDNTWGVLLEGWCKPRKIDLMLLAMKRFVDGLPGHRVKDNPSISQAGGTTFNQQRTVMQCFSFILIHRGPERGLNPRLSDYQWQGKRDISHTFDLRHHRTSGKHRAFVIKNAATQACKRGTNPIIRSAFAIDDAVSGAAYALVNLFFKFCRQRTAAQSGKLFQRNARYLGA
jgi:hypothetical protein